MYIVFHYHIVLEDELYLVFPLRDLDRFTEVTHTASVYNGHLRGPVTLTPITERLAVELSLPVLTT